MNSLGRTTTNAWDRRTSALFVAGAAVLAVFLAVRVTEIGFLSDDWFLVNRASQGIADVFSTSWTGEREAGGYYRPAAIVSLYLDSLISGGSASWFHLTNLALHVACSILVALAFRELSPRSSRGAVTTVGTLFFVLPIHTDVVFWVAGRVDSLCALGSLASIILWARFLRRPRFTTAALTVLFTLLALCSKEMAVTVPLQLLVVTWAIGVRFRRQTLVAAGATLVAFLLWLLARWFVLGHPLDPGPNSVGSLVPALKNLVIASASLFRANVHVVDATTTLSAALGIIVPLLTATAILGRSGGSPWTRTVGVTAALFLISLSPAIAVVARWQLYLPSAFACMCVTRIWESWATHSRARLTATRLGSTAFLVGAGLVLAIESSAWIDASRLSDRIVSQVMARTVENGASTVVLFNVPATRTRPECVGEQPVFVNGLEIAVAQAGGNRCYIGSYLLSRSDDLSIEVTAPSPGTVRWELAGGEHWMPSTRHAPWGITEFPSPSAVVFAPSDSAFDAYDLLWFDGTEVARLPR